MMIEKKRSVGVLIFAIIIFIISVFQFALGTILFILLQEISGTEVTLMDRIQATWYCFVVALALIISGIGLLKLKSWAPIVTILAWLAQLYQFLPYCLSDFSDIFPFSVYTIILVSLIWFFTRLAVKEQFK